MALTGELEFYAAGSGLPASATLAEHQAGYWRAQLPGDAPTDTLDELEYAFYLQELLLTRADVSLVDARLLYFRIAAGFDGAVNDLMVEVFTGGGGPPPPIVKTYRQSAVTGANLQTYTFPAQPIGAEESPTRRVVAEVSWRTASITQPLTEVTIGGVVASLDNITGSVTGNQVAIVSAVVPTGSAADVVVSLSEVAARCGIGLWTLSAGSPKAVSNGSGMSTLDLTIVTDPGDAVIAGVASNTTGVTFEWTNAAERYDEVIEAGFDHSGADAEAAGASVAVGVAASAGSANTGMAVAYGY